MNLIEKYGVDAYGLVQRYGGIDKCKEIIENAPPDAECYSWLLGDSGVRDKTVYLDDLRTAIANHDLTVSNSSQNDKQIDLSIKKDIEDHCTDIRNHISPNTKVIERWVV